MGGLSASLNAANEFTALPQTCKMPIMLPAAMLRDNCRDFKFYHNLKLSIQEKIENVKLFLYEGRLSK